jgi:type I restriction enzyme R subunit
MRPVRRRNSESIAEEGRGRHLGSHRVDRALARLRKVHRFTDPQSKWLDRTAKRVKIETVVDRASLDAGQFKTDGGFARLNKVFGGKLEALLGELADE